MQTVVGIFTSQVAAEHAAEQLRRLGIARDQIHFLNRSARHWYTDTDVQARILGCSRKHVYESHAL